MSQTKDFCSKNGDIIWISESIGDDIVVVPKRMRGKPKHNKWDRHELYKKNLKRLEQLTGWSPSGAYVCNRGQPNEFIKRYWRGHRSKYLKRQSNKAIRRFRGYIDSGGSYKKHFDYWWELW